MIENLKNPVNNNTSFVIFINVFRFSLIFLISKTLEALHSIAQNKKRNVTHWAEVVEVMVGSIVGVIVRFDFLILSLFSSFFI